MNLLYITFGNNVAIHLQAAFSIYSFLAGKTPYSTINIVTDNPAYYQHLSEKVIIIPVTAAELKSWEGEHRFFWRIKIKALEKVAALYPDNPIVYLDTDTIFYGDTNILPDGLKTGQAFMHENEGPISTQKSKTLKKMWKHIREKTYGTIPMVKHDGMWNAGVVAFPNNKGGEECKLALTICDEMCAGGVTRRLIEQYALCVALGHHYHLSESRNFIAHYWAVKENWNEKISRFFLTAHFQRWTFEQTILEFKDLDLTHLPVYERVRSTNLRIKNFADKMYPPENRIHLH